MSRNLPAWLNASVVLWGGATCLLALGACSGAERSDGVERPPQDPPFSHRGAPGTAGITAPPPPPPPLSTQETPDSPARPSSTLATTQPPSSRRAPQLALPAAASGGGTNSEDDVDDGLTAELASKPAPESQSAGSTPCAPHSAQATATRPRRIWKLTPDQLERSAHALLPKTELSIEILPDGASPANGSFSNLAELQTLSAPHVEKLVDLADEFAVGFVEERSAWPPCLEGERLDPECLRSFLTEFLERSFRRPAKPAEVQRYADFFVRQSDERGAHRALGQLARAVFLSPGFQFRTELGTTATGLSSMTPYERASALSYGLADAPPDEQLMNAAAQSQLETSEQLEAQVRRLLASPESGRGIKKFLLEHFGIERVLAEDRDEKQYPNWYWGLARRLVGETEAFFDEVLWRDDARLSTLLTADYSMLNDDIAPVYGLEPTDSSALQKRTLPSGQRSGVLTQAAFLASMGGYSAPDITRRGAHLRTRLMCQQLPPPPIELPPIAAVEGISNRERLETVHLENPACRDCHRLMDPLGFALEHYDSVGGWRTEERVGDDKIAVDASGTISASSQGDVAVAGGQQLGQALADLPEVHECFVGQLARYIAGGQHSADDCRIARASEAFRAADGDVFEAVVALLADEQSYRRGD